MVRRRAKSSCAEIEDEGIAFIDNPLVETVGNSSGVRLVDDTGRIHARYRFEILGGLSLGVVEVS